MYLNGTEKLFNQKSGGQKKNRKNTRQWKECNKEISQNEDHKEKILKRSLKIKMRYEYNLNSNLLNYSYQHLMLLWFLFWPTDFL